MGASSYLECRGDVVYSSFYANSGDCSSTPLSTPVCSNPDLTQNGTCIEVCDQGPCSYATVQIRNETADCSTPVQYTVPVLAEYCISLDGQSGSIYNCNGENVTQHVYEQTDWSGDPLYSIPFTPGSCFAGFSVGSCTTASTNAPTSATPAPVEGVTPMPTLAPVFNDLTCNGILFGVSGFYEMGIAGGFCIGKTGESAKIVCKNGSPVIYNYTNSDCSGDPFDISDACETILSEIFGDESDIPDGYAFCNSYCGLGPCDVFITRSYENADSCDGNEPVDADNDMVYEEEPFLIGHCSYNGIAGIGQKYESNGTHILSKQYATTDCSGTESFTEVYEKIGSSCVGNGTVIAHNTYLVEFQPTSEPTVEPSVELTPEPSESTPTPIDPNEGNGAGSVSLIGFIFMTVVAAAL